MNSGNHLTKLLLLIMTMPLFSCNIIPRRLYLDNKTDKAVTLSVDTAFAAEKGTILFAFKEALNGKHIEPGHLTIPFGKGKWEKPDEESLKKLLQHIVITKAGSSQGFKLPKDILVGHGLLIPELIVYIDEP